LIMGDNYTIRNCVIRDQLAEDIPGKRYPGFYFHNGNNLLLENNDIYGNGAGGQVYPGPWNNVVIRNNRIHHNNTKLTTQTIGGITVSKDSSLFPITNVQIYNNLIYNNGNINAAAAWGINIAYGVEGAKIWNNTIYGQIAIGDGGYGIAINGTPPVNTVIQNNIVYQNSGGAIANGGIGTIIDHNFTTNPSFVNAAAFNFDLPTSSPAIDAGVALSHVTTDIKNISRPQGAAYDIGAYEIGTGDSSPPSAPRNLTVN